MIGAMEMPMDFRYREVYLQGPPRHRPRDAFRAKHPPMDRGKRAKLFAPFDALRGFREMVAEQEGSCRDSAYYVKTDDCYWEAWEMEKERKGR